MSARDICPQCGSMYSLHDETCGELADLKVKLESKARRIEILEKEIDVLMDDYKLEIALKLIEALIESHEGTYGEGFWESPMGIKSRDVLAKIRGDG